MKKFQRVLRVLLFILLLILAITGIGLAGGISGGIMMRDPKTDQLVKTELYEAPKKNKEKKSVMLNKN